MPTTQRFATGDGIEIAYHEYDPDRPEAGLPPVVLHHGFAADTVTNWVSPGVVDALLDAGRSVISVDARGHGASDKPHDPDHYGEGRMSADLLELLDDLALERIDLVGYSMGAIVSTIAASRDRRIRRLVIGGIGGRIARLGDGTTTGLDRSAIAEALLADDPDTVTDPSARAFRRFADSTGGDRLALAAQMRSAHTSRIALGDITAPTLLIVGDRDPLADDPDALVAAIPECRLQVVPGDHLDAVAAAGFRESLVDFLAG